MTKKTNPGAKNPQALIAELFAAVNENDWGRAAALATQDFSDSDQIVAGPPGLVAPYGELLAAFPELQLAIEDLFATGDQVAVRYHGRAAQRGVFQGVPPGGRTVSVDGLDVFQLEDGRICGRRSYLDRLSILQQLSDPQPPELPQTPTDVQIITRFEPPAFLEGVMLGRDGSVYVSKLHEGTVYRVQADGHAQPFFHLDTGDGPWNGVWCMVAPPDGAGFFLNVNSNDAAKHGVWYVDETGAGRQFAALPLDTVPNGIARSPDNDLLVADSIGRIWRIAPDGRSTVWLQHDLLAGRPYIGKFPGANGIQIWNDAAYVTNSDLALMLRIAIKPDGTAGAPVILAEDIGGDDFAIDDEGSLYITTHPFNAVVKLDARGNRTIVGAADQGVIGPTAAALATEDGGRRVLYVVADGGFYTLPGDPPIPAAAQTPVLLKIRL